MSIDGILGGLELTGIGFQNYYNGNAKIGFVIPEDLNVAVKYNDAFSTYFKKHGEMQYLLKLLQNARYTVKRTEISEKVTIFGGLPAFGAWDCYEIIPPNTAYGNGDESDDIYNKQSTEKIESIIGSSDLIPTKF